MPSPQSRALLFQARFHRFRLGGGFIVLVLFADGNGTFVQNQFAAARSPQRVTLSLAWQYLGPLPAGIESTQYSTVPMQGYVAEACGLTARALHAWPLWKTASLSA